MRPGLGLSLIGLGAAISLAAFSSGNNTFLLLAATIFSTVAISKWKGRRFIAGLSLEGFTPAGGLFARVEGELSLCLRSRRGPMAVGLAHPCAGEDATGVATPLGRTISWGVRPVCRGSWRLEGLTVSSRAPYGLTRERRARRIESAVVVFPEPARDVDLKAILSSRRGCASRSSARASGVGADFLGLRDYHPEDGSRRIHWKALARSGDLVSKILEEDDEKALLLHLDPWIPADTVPFRERFELAVSRLTAAILQAHDLGRPFALSIGCRTFRSGRGLSHRNAALRILAEIAPVVAGVPTSSPRSERAIPFGALVEK